jgi:hypothetical protein
MDLFDDALAETAMGAPSQDITHTAWHAATPSDCIVILDDKDEHCAEALSQAPEAPSQAPVQRTCETPPCPKRASAQADHQAVQKRKCSRKSALNLKAWEEVEGDVVTCALVPSGKTVVLVPAAMEPSVPLPQVICYTCGTPWFQAAFIGVFCTNCDDENQRAAEEKVRRTTVRYSDASPDSQGICVSWKASWTGQDLLREVNRLGGRNDIRRLEYRGARLWEGDLVDHVVQETDVWTAIP